MSNFSKSFQLVKQSFSVLKKDKEIMLFPIISAILTIVAFMSFMIPFFMTGLFRTISETLGGYSFWLIVFFYYILNYFIITFLNVGLITCANIRLGGGDPTFGDGFRNAAKNIGKIFIWALISATVGVILRMISDKQKTVGRIIAGIIGMAWNLLTFFVVPVMIFEKTSPTESIKKSGELFKKTWGENAIAQFSMAGFFTLLNLGIFLVAFALGIFAVVSLKSAIVTLAIFLLMVLVLIVLSIISSCLNGIFVVALYKYANDGQIPSVYDSEIIQNAFKSKNF